MIVKLTGELEIPDGSKPLHPNYPNTWVTPDGRILKLSPRVMAHEIRVGASGEATLTNSEGRRRPMENLLGFVAHARHGPPEPFSRAEAKDGNPTNLSEGNVVWVKDHALARASTQDPELQGLASSAL